MDEYKPLAKKLSVIGFYIVDSIFEPRVVLRDGPPSEISKYVETCARCDENLRGFKVQRRAVLAQLRTEDDG
jgi:hypothetical protein